MSLADISISPVHNHHGILPDLVSPPPSLLANLLESRVAHERSQLPKAPLPPGVRFDLRPNLPKIGTAAVMIYAHRQYVESFPLLFTVLALAHPN